MTLFVWNVHFEHNHFTGVKEPNHFLDLRKMLEISHSITHFQSCCASLCKKCLFSTSPPRLTVCSSLINTFRRVLCMSQSMYVHLWKTWEYNMWDAFVDIDYSGLKSPRYYNSRESAFNTLKVDEPHHTLLRARSTGSTYLHRPKSYLHVKDKQVVKKKKKRKMYTKSLHVLVLMVSVQAQTVLSV